jgi:type IV pilus assembly protein PilM
MWKFQQTNTQPIGLDLGHDSVKLLQLEVHGGSSLDSPGAPRTLSVVAAARHSISEEARTNPARRVELCADIIQRLLAQQPFVGRKVVATLPREVVHIKNLRLPIIPADELEAAVSFEAKSIFGFDTDDAIVQFLPAGEVRQGNESRQEIIVLAAKNADIENYLQQLNTCGVEVQGLDTEITGLFRSFERFIRRREDEAEVQILIDIGARRTQVIIGKGRDISFYKPVEIGGLHLLSAVSRKLTISLDEARALRQRLLDTETPVEPAPGPTRRDPVRQAVFDATRSVAEELGQELAMCLRYFTVTFRGHRPTRARLLGGEATDPQLQAVLNSMLNVPVEAGRPLFSVDTSRMRAADRRGPMSQWALAAGLSMRFVQGYFSQKDGRARAIVAAAPAPSAPIEISNAPPAEVPMAVESTPALEASHA